MSYLSILATVGWHADTEIVDHRVKVSAFAEPEGEAIILHVYKPDRIGPVVCDAKNARVVVFENVTGGEPLCTLFTVDEIQAGQHIGLGTRTL